jgi:RNA polymerase-binding transcription factor DksA
MKTEHFRKKLEEEKIKLESEMGNIGRRNPLVPNDWEPSPPEENIESDIADQADIIVRRENDAAILSDLEAHYDTILAALSRIENGTYGKCEVCGAKIEEARLEADPAAVTCVKHL